MKPDSLFQRSHSKRLRPFGKRVSKIQRLSEWQRTVETHKVRDRDREMLPDTNTRQPGLEKPSVMTGPPCILPGSRQRNLFRTPFPCERACSPSSSRVTNSSRGLSGTQATASLTCSQEPRMQLVQGCRPRTKAHISRLGSVIVEAAVEHLWSEPG